MSFYPPFRFVYFGSHYSCDENIRVLKGLKYTDLSPNVLLDSVLMGLKSDKIGWCL